MRTTIELRDEHRARLLELAARRGEKGFSSVIAEALDEHLRRHDAGPVERRRALALRGTLSASDADRLRSTVEAIRESWR
jgi:predicted transcriptional regulator